MKLFSGADRHSGEPGGANNLVAAANKFAGMFPLSRPFIEKGLALAGQSSLRQPQTPLAPEHFEAAFSQWSQQLGYDPARGYEGQSSLLHPIMAHVLASQHDLVVPIARGGLLAGFYFGMADAKIKLVQPAGQPSELAQWLNPNPVEGAGVGLGFSDLQGRSVLIVAREVNTGAAVNSVVRFLKEEYRATNVNLVLGDSVQTNYERERIRGVVDPQVSLIYDLSQYCIHNQAVIDEAYRKLAEGVHTLLNADAKS